jgi:hypothetical protein
MKFKALRNRAQTIALAGSAVCLASSSWTLHLYLNRLSDDDKILAILFILYGG